MWAGFVTDPAEKHKQSAAMVVSNLEAICSPSDSVISWVIPAYTGTLSLKECFFNCLM